MDERLGEAEARVVDHLAAEDPVKAALDARMRPPSHLQDLALHERRVPGDRPLLEEVLLPHLDPERAQVWRRLARDEEHLHVRQFVRLAARDGAGKERLVDLVRQRLGEALRQRAQLIGLGHSQCLDPIGRATLAARSTFGPLRASHTASSWSSAINRRARRGSRSAQRLVDPFGEALGLDRERLDPSASRFAVGWWARLSAKTIASTRCAASTSHSKRASAQSGRAIVSSAAGA